MSDKIKLEDMTLREIGELKCYMANNIRNAIYEIVRTFNEQYDCGIPIIKVNTDVEKQVFEFVGSWDEERLTQVNYDIKIKFSKDDEQ